METTKSPKEAFGSEIARVPDDAYCPLVGFWLRAIDRFLESVNLEQRALTLLRSHIKTSKPTNLGITSVVRHLRCMQQIELPRP